MKAWATMNIGASLIILGISIILAFAGVFQVSGAQRLDLAFPFILAAYGVWLLVLALLKQLAKPTIYEYPPLMVGGWGILIGGTGFLWISTTIYGGIFSVLALAILAVAVGAILVAYSFLKR